MQRLVICALMLGAAGWMGCAPTGVRSVERVPPPGEPQITVSFRDNTSWPYELDRVRLSIDGVEVLDRLVDDRERPAYEIGPIGAVVGEHTLSVETTTSYTSTRVDRADCGVQLRASHTFYVHDQHAAIDVDLYLRGVTTAFAKRPSLSFATRGASAMGDSDPQRRVTRSEACRDDGPLPFSDEDIALDHAPQPYPWRLR